MRDGLVMGSIDCEFSVFVGDMTPEDTDAEMMSVTDDDAIVSASVGSGGASANDGDAMSADGDGFCETIGWHDISYEDILL
mmetsp:Transcript_34170/g.39322  ORF Transcript_34170/g.39322 Transcript_34170/m.39322 type:complete len:81 (-) Transcript_34170:198-440(-)